MSRGKLLVVYSYAETSVLQIAEHRVESAERHGYRMEICFAMPTPQVTLTGSALRERLQFELRRTAAAYLVVHMGYAYMLYPEAFVEAIPQIAESFPNVEIILEKLDDTTSFLERRGLLSHAPDVEQIRRIVFAT